MRAKRAIMMTSRVAVIIGVLALVGACKKAADAPAAGSGSGSSVGSGSSAPVKQSTPPPAPASKLGEKVGDDFSKIDPWGTAASGDAVATPPTFAAKIDVATLAAPVDDKIDLKSLTGATTETAGFRVAYNPSKKAVHEQYRKLFESNRVFEEIASGLNRTIRVPTAVDINTLDCEAINAFYDPNNKRIIICYELVSYFLSMFKPVAKTETELGNAVLGALVFAFFHEVGHGLIHVLDLPAVGREEDSADQLATLILIAAGDEGVAMALSGAYWFQLQGQGGHKTPFWDEHAFDHQRFYNVMCLIYGSNAEKYAGFVEAGTLPKERAERCGEEFVKIKAAWEKLLGPHLTNGAALNIDYKPPVPPAEAPKTTNDDPWGDGGDDGDTKPPPQPTRAITCEQVAERAAILIAEEAAERAQAMSADEVEDLKAKLEAELPAVIQTILSECVKEDWSDGVRKCVVKAKTLAQATKCQ
jgi:hypothetical protein